MAEYIRREDAYTTLTDYYHHSTKIQHMALKEALDRVPAADVVERKTGKWEEVEIKWLDDDPDLKIEAVASMRCPICERYHNEVYYYGDPRQMARFCGFCGAKMIGGDDDV